MPATVTTLAVALLIGAAWDPFSAQISTEVAATTKTGNIGARDGLYGVPDPMKTAADRRSESPQETSPANPAGHEDRDRALKIVLKVVLVVSVIGLSALVGVLVWSGFVRRHRSARSVPPAALILGLGETPSAPRSAPEDRRPARAA